VASLDAPKTMNNEHTCRSRPVKDAVHQEDAPYIEERKGLVIERGIVKKISIKDDEHQETKCLIIGQGIVGKVATKRTECPGMFIRTVEGANDAPASNIKLEKDECQETFAPIIAGENHVPAPNIRRNECSETFA
jgi:hypothetical protein